METESTQAAIEALLDEQRTFPPPEEFAADAVVKDESVYRRAEEDPEGFWRDLAGEFISWFKEPTQGAGVGSAALHVVRRRRAERRLRTASTGTSRPGRGDRVAYHWVGEPGGRERAT